MLAGLSAVAGTAMVGGALPWPRRQGKPVVGLRYQNFKRGTIHSLDPATRGLVIVWEDLGRVKLKAADLVINYAPGGTKRDDRSGGRAQGRPDRRRPVVRLYRLPRRADDARSFGEGQGDGRQRRAAEAFPTASSRSG